MEVAEDVGIASAGMNWRGDERKRSKRNEIIIPEERGNNELN